MKYLNDTGLERLIQKIDEQNYVGSDDRSTRNIRKLSFTDYSQLKLAGLLNADTIYDVHDSLDDNAYLSVPIPKSEFYVDDATGVNDNSYDRGLSWDKPFKSIMYAIDMIKNKVTGPSRPIIYIAPGVYEDSYTIDIGITLFGAEFGTKNPADPNVIILKAPELPSNTVFYLYAVFLLYENCFIDFHNLTLRGFVYSNPSDAIRQFIVATSYSVCVLFRNCNFESMSRHTIGIGASWSTHVHIDSCSIKGVNWSRLFDITAGYLDINVLTCYESTLNTYSTTSNSAAGTGHIATVSRAGRLVLYNNITIFPTVVGIRYYVEDLGRLTRVSQLPNATVAGSTATGGAVQ